MDLLEERVGTVRDHLREIQAIRHLTDFSEGGDERAIRRGYLTSANGKVGDDSEQLHEALRIMMHN